MSRKTTPAASPALTSRSVIGLDLGRERARRRAGRKRFKNGFVALVVFLVLGAVVGAAGYYFLDFYREEQDRNSNDGGVVRDGPSTEELISRIENEPRWNGPGAPAFGVGEEPVSP